MTNVSAKVAAKIKTRLLYTITFFSKIVPFMRQCGNTLYSQAGHRLQNSAYTLYAG